LQKQPGWTISGELAGVRKFCAEEIDA